MKLFLICAQPAFLAMFFLNNDDNGTLCLDSSLEFSNNVHITISFDPSKGCMREKRLSRNESPGLHQPADFSKGRCRTAPALRVSADSSSYISCLVLSLPRLSPSCSVTHPVSLPPRRIPTLVCTAGWVNPSPLTPDSSPTFSKESSLAFCSLRPATLAYPPLPP